MLMGGDRTKFGHATGTRAASVDHDLDLLVFFRLRLGETRLSRRFFVGNQNRVKLFALDSSLTNFLAEVFCFLDVAGS